MRSTDSTAKFYRNTRTREKDGKVYSRDARVTHSLGEEQMERGDSRLGGCTT